MSETREYFQRKYPEFIDDIERRFNFTIGNLPVPTNDQQWLDLVKLVYSGASAAKDASIRDYMNICEDLSRKLEEARGRIAELEAAVAGKVKLIDPTPETIAWAEGVFAAEAAKDARIAELEQQLKHEKASHELLAEDFAEVYSEREKGFARIAELEAAIKPFAAINPTIIGGEELPHYWVVNGSPIRSSFTADDLRNARSKLEGKSDA